MKPKDIWNSSEWTRRRRLHRRYKSWFDGLPLDETQDRMDRSTGSKLKKFPLRINLFKLACSVHGEISRGLADRNDTLFVRASIPRDTENAEELERAINDLVWRASNGQAIQQEALVSMNIYGGTVLKLSYEPWNEFLPLRLAVRHIKDPAAIYPVWVDDPWSMEECYYGKEISARQAELKYGVKTKSDTALYMEHWTRDEFKVTIDDSVPVMKWDNRTWKLQGDNEWGVVPFFYAPHERVTDLFGEGHLDEQEGLTLELNARMTNISDMIGSTRPGLLWARDIDRQLRSVPVELNGELLTQVIDMGRTRAVQHANPPSIEPTPIPDIPESIANFASGTLSSFWMMVARLSPAIFGMDDTKSGRITGPAILQRMYTSAAHCGTERTNFATAKSLLDRAIIVALLRSQIGEIVDIPNVSESDIHAIINQVWLPMMPQDRKEQAEEMTARLAQGAISIESYLSELGEADVERERERILSWLEDKKESEGANQPQGMEGAEQPSADSGSGSQNVSE